MNDQPTDAELNGVPTTEGLVQEMGNDGTPLLEEPVRDILFIRQSPLSGLATWWRWLRSCTSDATRP